MANSSEEQRKEFICNLLRDEFGRGVIRIRQLGRHSNNFVYRLQLAETHGQAKTPNSKPGTVTLPAEEPEVVIRISNPQAMVNEDARVQNEVAAMALMKQALSGDHDSLVPRVFGWAPSSSGHGWILQEYMRGTPLDTVFKSLDQESLRGVIRQIANIFKLIQSYQLPDTVTGYGGLSFNDSGDIVSGATTIPCGGPFPAFHEMYTCMLQRQLIESDKSERIAGWRHNGIRDRLEPFASTGIARAVQAHSDPHQTLVHGDFNTFNMLYDSATNRLTAILDFDFAHVASPADEYFYSFRTLGALLAGPFESGDEGKLRECLLDGFEADVPLDTGGRVNWKAAVLTDQEFARAGVLRPADIRGCGELAGLKWFLEDVAPPYFFMPRWVENMDPKKISDIQKEITGNVESYLERYGF